MDLDNVIFGMLVAILVTIATEWANQQPDMRSHDLIHPSLLVIVSLSSNRNKLFKNVIFGMSAAILVTIATEWTNQQPHMRSHDLIHPLLLVIVSLSSNRNKLLKNVIFGMSAAILVTIATKQKEPIRNLKCGHMTLSTHHYYVRWRLDKNRFKTPYITTIISFYWYICSVKFFRCSNI